MAFNGSGTFLRLYSWVTDAANNIFVRADRMDAEMDGMATGLSTCLTKDGQTTPTANIQMGGFKITGLATGTGNTDAASVQNANAHTCEFRLTLTTGLPVTTADVTGTATLYFTPYKGNKIALYDGTNWVMRTSAEVSISNGTASASLPHDVFAYDNAGTLTLEYLAWTNDTTRATALTTQDGVLVKTGALTRRYIGTFRTTGASTFADNLGFRWLWNMYNRVRRPMRVLEDTDSWNYTTATIRQANARAQNQLDCVIGVSEDSVSVEIQATVSNTGGAVFVGVGVGLDSTSTFTSGGIFWSGNTQVANVKVGVLARWKGFPGAGRHFLSWNEYSEASGTTSWQGDNGQPTLVQAGIYGEIFA